MINMGGVNTAVESGGRSPIHALIRSPLALEQLRVAGEA